MGCTHAYYTYVPGLCFRYVWPSLSLPPAYIVFRSDTAASLSSRDGTCMIVMYLPTQRARQHKSILHKNRRLETDVPIADCGLSPWNMRRRLRTLHPRTFGCTCRLQSAPAQFLATATLPNGCGVCCVLGLAAKEVLGLQWCTLQHSQIGSSRKEETTSRKVSPI